MVFNPAEITPESEKEKLAEREGEQNIAKRKLEQTIRLKLKEEAERESKAKTELALQHKRLNKELIANLRKDGFGVYRRINQEDYFAIAVQKACTRWIEKFGPECKGINQQQFTEAVYRYLDSRKYLKQNHYLRGLQQEHLNKLFDLYALIRADQNYRMNLHEFAHVFLYLLRENIAKETNEISLAQTIDAMVGQARFIKDKLRCLSLMRATDEVQSSGEPIITIAEGKAHGADDKRTSWGLDFILHVKHEKTGKILNFSLLYCQPVEPEEEVKLNLSVMQDEDNLEKQKVKLAMSVRAKKTVCFADPYGNAHEDLSYLDDLIEDLKTLDLEPEELDRKFAKHYWKRIHLPSVVEHKAVPAASQSNQAAEPVSASTPTPPNLFRPALIRQQSSKERIDSNKLPPP